MEIFFRSSKLLLVSNTYERRAIRQEELCHFIDMMKCLPTHEGALEQELSVSLALGRNDQAFVVLPFSVINWGSSLREHNLSLKKKKNEATHEGATDSNRD